MSCSICVRAKMHRLQFTSRRHHRASRRGEIIHSDLCSFETQSREGFRYWVTFINDYSKETFVYTLKYKHQTFSSFKHFKALFENHDGSTIQHLVSDNGGEYVSKEFQEFLLSEGIQHKPGPPHSPELNGVAERANRTLCERVRCLSIQAKVPKTFWADALRHITFFINSIPCNTPAGFNSPDNINGKPQVDPKHLHPFGCLVWYKVPEVDRLKLDPKGQASILLSYIANGAGYHVWDLGAKKVIKSRDVIFVESHFPYTNGLSLPQERPPPVEIVQSWPIRDSTDGRQPALVPLPDSSDGDFRTPPSTPPDGPSSPAHRPSPPSTPPVRTPVTPPRRSGRTVKNPDHLGNWANKSETVEELDTPKT